MTASTPSQVRRFPFRLTRSIRLWGWLFGVGIRPTEVVLDERGVTVRYGWFGAHVSWDEITRFELRGPFIWIRAIAARHTLFHHDFSFLNDARGAVVLVLNRRRRMYWASSVDELYLGVEDLDGLARALRERGLTGEDNHRN